MLGLRNSKLGWIPYPPGFHSISGGNKYERRNKMCLLQAESALVFENLGSLIPQQTHTGSICLLKTMFHVNFTKTYIYNTKSINNIVLCNSSIRKGFLELEFSFKNP